MQSRREFLQLASITAMLIGVRPWSSIAAKQELNIDDILKFDSKGQVTLLHLTDIHGQLKPVFFRPPSENYRVGKFEGIPPHLVGEAFLNYFDIKPNTCLLYTSPSPRDAPLDRLPS